MELNLTVEQKPKVVKRVVELMVAGSHGWLSERQCGSRKQMSDFSRAPSGDRRRLGGLSRSPAETGDGLGAMDGWMDSRAPSGDRYRPR